MPPLPHRSLVAPEDGGGAAAAPDSAAGYRLAPTLANISLPPRRPLRDGSSSTSSSRSASTSSRGSRSGSVLRGTKRSRSTSHGHEGEPIASRSIGEDSAEASRRLPRLQARTPAQSRALVRHDSSEDEDDGDRDNVVLNGDAHVDIALPAETHDIEVPQRTQSTTPSDGHRRFTAQEKGKGRAPPPSVTPEVFEIDDSDSSDDAPLAAKSANESVQFIASSVAPPPVEDEDVADIIDEHSSLSAFMCPVCFCAPTNPALTPCGHVLCYSCLHSSLLASIGRNPSPWPNQYRGRGRGGRGRGARGRGRGRGRAAGLGPALQPPTWDRDTLSAALDAEQDTIVRARLESDGLEGDAVEAVLNADRDSRGEQELAQPLNGLWQVKGGQWIVEGDCPVCRKPIPGGLGPLGSDVGGVVMLQARVAHAGETDVPVVAA